MTTMYNILRKLVYLLHPVSKIPTYIHFFNCIVCRYLYTVGICGVGTHNSILEQVYQIQKK